MSEGPAVTAGESGPLGVVVIGRNEGARLVQCLESVRRGGRVVYVDSGSTDGSVGRARDLGAEVVELDLAAPFTAARARNEGFARLRALEPGVGFVQFVDGDCEVREGWFGHALRAMESDSRVWVVCGRLRERHPERSVYNLACDVGWEHPAGDVESCGGVAMFRAGAFASVGGFDAGWIAGEEFELCARVRRAGGRVLRLDAEMAWHDVGITRVDQWWKRAVRAGFSYAEGWAAHGPVVGRSHRRSALRAVFWGLMLPGLFILSAAGAAFWPPLVAVAAGALGLVVLQALRLVRAQAGRGRSARQALIVGVLLLLVKAPEVHGVLRYCSARLFSRRTGIIEYR